MSALWATLFLACCFYVAYKLGYQNGKHEAIKKYAAHIEGDATP